MKSSETRTNEYTIKEQCPDSAPVEIKVNILSEGGQLWIQPQGYGEKCAMDDEGWPIGIEIWQGRLRLIVFADINREYPQIINLERAKETARRDWVEHLHNLDVRQVPVLLCEYNNRTACCKRSEPL